MAELAAKGDGIVPELAEVERDIRLRDNRDSSRETAPLAQAPDAVVVDTSSLDAPSVVAHLLELITGDGSDDAKRA